MQSVFDYIAAKDNGSVSVVVSFDAFGITNQEEYLKNKVFGHVKTFL